MIHIVGIDTSSLPSIVSWLLYFLPVAFGINARGGSSGSHPGVPTWARGPAEWTFGGDKGDTGIVGDAKTGVGGFDFGALLKALGPSMNAAINGGSVQRDLAAGATGTAMANTGNIAAGSMGALGGQNDILNQQSSLFGGAQNAIGQQNQLNSLVPQMLQAANQFAGNINQGENAYNTALGGATQSMNNVMNPTMNNPLFQNAMQNQIAPSINAQFSSRGLGSGGAPISAISAAGSGLADQFAQRQFQEQLGAQQNITNIGQGLVQSGVQGAQLPGQIYNQFQQGLGQSAQLPGQVFNQFLAGQGQAQQNFGQANQNQLAQLQALGMGSQQFWQGVNNPIATGQSMYDLSRNPMHALLSGITGVTGGIGNSKDWGFGIASG